MTSRQSLPFPKDHLFSLKLYTGGVGVFVPRHHHQPISYHFDSMGNQIWKIGWNYTSSLAVL